MTTLLIFRPRVPAYKRRAALRTLQRFYPRARLQGEAVALRHRRGDTKPLWLFLLSKLFNHIA